MPKIGLILSGCGVFDGSEIQEAVAVLHAASVRGVEVACFAPDAELDEIDHRTQQPTGATRSVLREAARISRGDITDLAEMDATAFDAIVLPGGFGAAKNLCTFASDGAECTVHPEVERALRQAHAARVPIGFLCISPVLAAKLFGEDGGPELTIGSDAGAAQAIEQMGASHTQAGHTSVVVDERQRIVSTPCYMLDSSVAQVFEGAAGVVDAVLEMATSASAG